MIKRNTRVILPADIAERIAEEHGTVILVQKKDMYLVKVDEPLDESDDCIREVHIDGIVEA